MSDKLKKPPGALGYAKNTNTKRIINRTTRNTISRIWPLMPAFFIIMPTFFCATKKMGAYMSAGNLYFAVILRRRSKGKWRIKFPDMWISIIVKNVGGYANWNVNEAPRHPLKMTNEQTNLHKVKSVRRSLHLKA
jgi:hypothetical protein